MGCLVALKTHPCEGRQGDQSIHFVYTLSVVRLLGLLVTIVHIVSGRML